MITQLPSSSRQSCYNVIAWVPYAVLNISTSYLFQNWKIVPLNPLHLLCGDLDILSIMLRYKSGTWYKSGTCNHSPSQATGFSREFQVSPWLKLLFQCKVLLLPFDHYFSPLSIGYHGGVDGPQGFSHRCGQATSRWPALGDI